MALAFILFLIGLLILALLSFLLIALDQRDEAQVERDGAQSSAHGFENAARRNVTDLHHERQRHAATERLLENSRKNEKYLLAENTRLIAQVAKLTRLRDARGRYAKKS